MDQQHPLFKAGLRKHNVMIPLNAAYFHEKAMQSLEKFHYAKAARYFRRAAELDPNNPTHWCNLAGALSEMGQYGESIEMLEYVLAEIDPDMVECHFFVANNLANLDEFELAEQRMIQFLTNRPDGPLDPEVEELVEWITFELDGPTVLTELVKREDLAAHDLARRLLEEGKFTEAIHTLEELVKEHPDFMPARNNLALAYYYIGQFDRAMQMVQELLERDPHNVHAMCNMAIFLQHVGHDQPLREWMDGLRKVLPVQPDHAFKLATTMGILGDHETAFRLFKRIQRSGDLYDDASLYHYLAVAAFQTDRLDVAEQMWKTAADLDPKSGVPDYYLNVLSRYRENRTKVMVSYHYHLPFEEQFRNLNQNDSNFPEKMRRDPLVRSSFFWALKYGDLQTKLQVLQAFSLIADKEVETALREFLLRTDENDDLKKVALFVLRSMGASEPFQMHVRGKVVTIHPDLADKPQGLGDPTWQDILTMAVEQMRSRFTVLELHEIQLIWFEYLSKKHPDVPRFLKLGGWAAALEYVNAKLHNRPVTYEDLAGRYDISVGTIRKYVKEIQSVCELTSPSQNS